MIRSLLVLATLAAPAAAQDSVDLSGTAVTIHPSERPGAIAEIRMDNRSNNSGRDEITFPMVLGDVAVAARFQWQAAGAADAVHVTPPEGVTCLPTSCVLVVEEYQTGTLFLFSVEGVGF